MNTSQTENRGCSHLLPITNPATVGFAAVLVLVALVSGCASTSAGLGYEGPELPPSQVATILLDGKTDLSLLKAVDGKSRHWGYYLMLNGVRTEGVRVLPGKHVIHACYCTPTYVDSLGRGTAYRAEPRIVCDVEAGHTYLIQAERKVTPPATSGKASQVSVVLSIKDTTPATK